MFPRILHIGSFNLTTYGVLVALALVVGLFTVVHFARREGIDPDRAWSLGLVCVFASIVGAKLLLVLNDWSFYSHNLRALFSFDFLQSAGVFSGGLVAAFVAGLFYALRHRMPVFKTMDVFAPAAALGHAIGRLGCFAAGCCYGKPTGLPWGVTFTNPLAYQTVGTPLNVPLHPTQIYEFLVELANFGVLVWLFRHKKFDGQIFGTYLFLYGIARYFLEFLRGDGDRGSAFNGLMTTTQLLSIVMVIAGGLLWMRMPRRQAGPATSAHA
jgi:phosphatidylglycerol:prolipoprotein diacylglycerol transferase